MKLYMVEFALKSAMVKVLSWHKVNDDDTIYHVQDIDTGRQDFVGSAYMKQQGGAE